MRLLISFKKEINSLFSINARGALMFYLALSIKRLELGHQLPADFNISANIQISKHAQEAISECLERTLCTRVSPIEVRALFAFYPLGAMKDYDKLIDLVDEPSGMFARTLRDKLETSYGVPMELQMVKDLEYYCY